MNPTFHHPGQPQMQAQVILASKGPEQDPIYTIRKRYPRIIHGEVMTHRVFSRNAGSSRARPAKVTIQEIRDTPFIPWHWGKNQSGMQAFEDNDTLLRLHQDNILSHLALQNLDVDETGWCDIDPRDGWSEAAHRAAEIAQAFADAGYHKQVFNRLLEPFSWIDVLVTATEWDNFLWLRDHEDAEPHIADLARLVKQAIDSCNIQELSPGEWHLPYITAEDLETIDREFNDGRTTVIEIARCVSAARCARVSYKLFDGSAPSIKGDLDLYQKLVGNARIHASPMEHQATPDILVGEHVPEWNQPELHGNLTGYIQFRKMIPGERWTAGMSG